MIVNWIYLVVDIHLGHIYIYSTCLYHTFVEPPFSWKHMFDLQRLHVLYYSRYAWLGGCRVSQLRKLIW